MPRHLIAIPRGRRSFVASAAGLAAAAAVHVPVRAAIEWKFGNDEPSNSPINVRAVEAVAAIKRDSGGRIDIKGFSDGELGSTPAMLTQLRLGAIQIQTVPGALLDALVPVAAIY